MRIRCSRERRCALAKILLIEDDDFYRQTLTRALSRARHEVQAVPSGREGITVSRWFRPQLVLIDWMLKSEQDGPEVAQELRQTDPELKLLLMTGYLNADSSEHI